MRLFTIEEAEELLPVVRSTLEEIQRMYRSLGSFRDGAQAAATSSSAGGGMHGGTAYVKILYKIGKLTTELHQTGVQLKDSSSGLIDFPAMRDGRVVLLCWRLGEGDRIEWWHEIEAGFAGRRPI